MAANKLSMNNLPAGSDWWVPTLALAGGIALMQGAVMALRIRKAVALILGGGNDVIRLTGNAALQADVGRALQLASERADTAVLMPAGNVGNTPFFPQPLAWLMRQRSLKLHALPAAQQRVPTRFISTARRKEMKTRLCVTPGGSTPQTDCIRAMTGTSCGSAHCKIRRRCRSSWRLWPGPGNTAVLQYCATAFLKAQ